MKKRAYLPPTSLVVVEAKKKCAKTASSNSSSSTQRKQNDAQVESLKRLRRRYSRLITPQRSRSEFWCERAHKFEWRCFPGEESNLVPITSNEGFAKKSSEEKEILVFVAGYARLEVIILRCVQKEIVV